MHSISCWVALYGRGQCRFCPNYLHTVVHNATQSQPFIPPWHLQYSLWKNDQRRVGNKVTMTKAAMFRQLRRTKSDDSLVTGNILIIRPASDVQRQQFVGMLLRQEMECTSEQTWQTRRMYQKHPQITSCSLEQLAQRWRGDNIRAAKVSNMTGYYDVAANAQTRHRARVTCSMSPRCYRTRPQRKYFNLPPPTNRDVLLG